MSMEPKINIEIAGDSSGAKKAFSDTTNSAQKMATDVTRSGGETAKQMETTSKSFSSSVKSVGTDMTLVAGLAVGVYNNFDRIEDSARRVDKAHLGLSRAIEEVEKKQKLANEALTKFGDKSTEYIDAARDLEQSQQKLQIQQGMTKDSEEELTKAYIGAATSTIPMVITMVEKLIASYTTLRGAAAAASAATGATGAAGGGAGVLGALGGATIAAPITAGVIGAYGVAETARLAQTPYEQRIKEMGFTTGQTIQTPYGPQVVGGGRSTQNQPVNVTVILTDVVNAKDPSSRKEFSRLIGQDVGNAVYSGIEP